ncbi:MAG: exo-alpha-sialidase, partial [Spirochaetaceae bacterium]|nr:exo-alpha-sialidase [Spirochaetaceae bacterium]
MNRIEVVDSGYVSRDDAAFPTLIKIDNAEIICAYTAKGKGPDALGGTDWSRSSDGGVTWFHEGTVLPRTENPVSVNSLRLSQVSDGTMLAYGGRDYLEGKGDSRSFGQDEKNEPVFCQSNNQGKTWSEISVIPTDFSLKFEISNPIVVAGNGTWLAPAATLPDRQRLGEKVVVFRSADRGKTWPEFSTVFYDEEKKKGFFEQKIISLGGGQLLAVAWTVTLGDYSDLENHFAFSDDYGLRWTTPKSTGIKGQTLSPLFLGEDRLLLLSNRRYGSQGVVCYFARFHRDEWTIEGETLLWDAHSSRDTKTESKSGIEAFDDFAFGLPSAIQLDNNLYLSV